MDLKQALHLFRKDAAVHKFGPAHLTDFGASAVMPNNVLQRIVDCVHHSKIKTKDDLVKETKWGGAEEYWEEVISLITVSNKSPDIRLAPSSSLLPCQNTGSAPLTDMLLRPHNTPGALSASTPGHRTPAKRQCSACGSHTHICKFPP